MALGKGLGSLIPNAKPTKKKSSKKKSSGSKSEGLLEVSISDIVPNPHQPRKHFAHAELEDLVESISQHGILQPLLVKESGDGGYQLIAGERRLRASTIAGLSKVPVVVRSANEEQQLELALIENIQREDLSPIEEAQAYHRLHKEFGLGHNEIAKAVGKSRPVISNTIRLLDLPEQIQQALSDGEINFTKARALLSLKKHKDQLELFEQMQKSINVTSSDIERSVAKKGAASRKGSIRRDPNIHAQEELIEERLGSKVKIAKKGVKGTITIHFSSKDEFNRLIKELT